MKDRSSREGPPPQTPLLMALEEFERDRRVRENDRLDRLAGENGEVRRYSTASGDDSSVSDDRYGGREVSHAHLDGSDSESSKSDVRYDGRERGSVDDSKSDGHLPSDDEDYLKEEDKEKGSRELRMSFNDLINSRNTDEMITTRHTSLGAGSLSCRVLLLLLQWRR